jgi:HAD superfamily hydrolase (TIGR01509 family)
LHIPTPSLKAVIFDLDGLLVDSEPLQFRAYQHAFSAHGIEFGEHDWATWHEVGASADAWLVFKGWRADPESIRSTKKAIYEQLIDAELTLKPGAAKLTQDLYSNGVRLCVASGSRIESIEACLNRFNLRQFFEGLFSATTARRRKPYPDVFELAMAEMGLSQSGTVVIEDSVVGLRAACAAGLPCVVCPDSFLVYDPDEYLGAALLIQSLSELDSNVLSEVLRA